MSKLDNAAQGLEGKQYKEANEFMKQIQYKEVLNKDELVDFYYNNKSKFKIPSWKIDKYIYKND